MTRLAVTYRRVSTERQAEEGVSLAAQAAEIERHCQSKGWEIHPELFEDAGRSGRTRNGRPGLANALKTVCESKGVLVAYSLSRLARSTRDAGAILDELRAAGADLCVLDLQLDTSGPVGQFVFTIIAALAQLESEMTGTRTRDALAHTRRNRGYSIQGRAPYGYQRSEGVNIPIPHEQLQIQRILAHHARGESCERIVARLTALGLTRRGGVAWHRESVRRVIERAKVQAAWGSRPQPA